MGFAAGFATGSNVASNIMDIRKQREEMRLMKETRDLQLQERGYFRNQQGQWEVSPNSPLGAEQNQMSQFANNLRKETILANTNKAIVDFSNSGDASYLQKMLIENPNSTELFKGMGYQHIEDVNFNDTDSLVKAGFIPEQLQNPKLQEAIKKNYFRAFDGNNWRTVPLQNLIAITGSAKRMVNTDKKQIANNIAILNSIKQGTDLSFNQGTEQQKIDLAKREFGLRKGESEQKIDLANREFGLRKGESEQKIDLANREFGLRKGESEQKIDLAKREFGLRKGESEQKIDLAKREFGLRKRHTEWLESTGAKKQALEERHTKWLEIMGEKELATKEKIARLKAAQDAGEKLTVTQKNIIAADDIRAGLINAFGGPSNWEKNYLEAQKNNTPLYKKWRHEVDKYQKLAGVQNSAKLVGDIADLKQLYDSAGVVLNSSGNKMSGAIDNLLANVDKYIGIRVDKNLLSRTAYSVFANSLRHSLFGAALSAGEQANFKQQLGSLNEDDKIILVQLGVNLKSLASRLETLQGSTDNFNFITRFNISPKNMEDMADVLINSTSPDEEVQGNFTSVVQSNSDNKPDGKKSLDSIFGGN